MRINKEQWVKNWTYLKKGNIKQIYRDWKSARFYNSDAYLDILTFDEDNKRYILNRSTVKERDIPPDVLAVTGEKHHYFKTPLAAPERVEVTEDGYITTSAVSNYLYLVNNDINDALAANWKGKPINLKMLAIIGAVILGVIVYVMVFK